jgi:putative endonuclease
MVEFYFVYVIQSLKDGKFYTGFTKDLNQRLNEHNAGKVSSTKYRIPFELVYYEASKDIHDAIHLEKT